MLEPGVNEYGQYATSPYPASGGGGGGGGFMSAVNGALNVVGSIATRGASTAGNYIAQVPSMAAKTGNWFVDNGTNLANTAGTLYGIYDGIKNRDDARQSVLVAPAAAAQPTVIPVGVGAAAQPSQAPAGQGVDLSSMVPILLVVGAFVLLSSRRAS